MPPANCQLAASQDGAAGCAVAGRAALAASTPGSRLQGCCTNASQADMTASASQFSMRRDSCSRKSRTLSLLLSASASSH